MEEKKSKMLIKRVLIIVTVLVSYGLLATILILSQPERPAVASKAETTVPEGTLSEQDDTGSNLPQATDYIFGADDSTVTDVENPDTGTDVENSDEVTTGLAYLDGVLYYYKDGRPFYAGLIQIDDEYYYVRSNGQVACNCTYWISKTNDLLPEGNYTFYCDGKMFMEGDGIVNVDDTLYYYHNGKPFYVGLISISGEYYYVRSNGQLAVNCSYWVTRTNGLMPEGEYTFGADGKMVLA